MNERRSAERRGRTAETLACLWLMAKGYRILAQRARTPYGEVDVAAWKRGELIIVEVKARRDEQTGLFSVSPRQRNRLMRAGLALMKRWRLGAIPVRYDLVVISPNRWPLHVRGAWRADDDPQPLR